MAVLRAPPSSVPESTWKTIGLLPFCCGGNLSASRSVARWLSVPGRLRSLVVSAPTRPTITTTATAITTHAISTSSGCRAIP